MMEKFFKNFKLSLQISIGITVLTLILLFVFTGQKQTWDAIFHARWELLLFVFVLWFVYLLLDAWKISLLAKEMGHEFSIWKSMEIILTGLFLAAITPFQTGGFPVQIYLMNKAGISPGKSMLILFIRGIFAFIIMAFALPIIHFRYAGAFQHMVTRTILMYLSLIYSFIIVFIIIISLFPRKMKRWTISFIRKFPEKFSNAIEKPIIHFFNEMEVFREVFSKLLKESKLTLFLLIVITAISFWAYFSMAPVILWSLRVDSPYVFPLMLQFLIVFMTFFSPTPGASGISEGTFALFYKSLCPTYLLGIYTFLWRFFIFYFGAILGGIILMHIIHKEGKRVDAFIEEAKALSDEEIDE